MPIRSSPPSFLKDIEKIYSFENIDPTSVRKIGSDSQKEKKNKELPQQDPLLDLFPSATCCFKEHEPLESLQLAPFTMKAIRSLSLKNIGQLQRTLMGDRSRLRSIGQGHLDELESKVNQFMLQAKLPHAPKADLPSCLRCILSPLSSKEQARLALVYGLKSMCFLSHGEEKEAEMSLRQIPPNMREKETSSLRSKLIAPATDIFSLLYDHFTIPALAERGGIVSTSTLTLLLYSESGLSSFSQFQALNRFFLTLTDEASAPWFASRGHLIDRHFIALSPPLAETASQLLISIKKLATLQADKPSLHELVSLLWKEEAHHWLDLDKRVLSEMVFWACTQTT